MDESLTGGAGGDFYVLGAAVVLADEDAARELFRAVIPAGRNGPFHWHKEGVWARGRMVEALGSAGAVAHVCVHHPTHKKRHEQARAAGMAKLIPQLAVEGIEHLLIEGREASQDVRDRGVILDVFREEHLGSPFTYDWGNKTEPLLWAADAVCGATRELVVGNPHYYKEMEAAGVIGGYHHAGPAGP
jgi:hypothetical protein